MISKTVLRREMLKKRAQLSPEAIEDAEKKSCLRIINHIKALVGSADALGARATVMSYMSYKNEFPTEKLNAMLLDEGFRLVLPYTDQDMVITAFYADSLGQLKKSKMGISEPDPTSAVKASPEDIDIVLMPLVACDLEGNRVGFGAGCYDRFLPSLNGRGWLIGLAYEMQVVDQITAEPTDIPLDYIITPERILTTDSKNKL